MEEEGGGSAGWSRSCWSRRWLTAPGCWQWARADAGTAVAEGPRGRGSSGSEQVRGDTRSSGAEWCWETVVEPFTPPSPPHSPRIQFDLSIAAPSTQLGDLDFSTVENKILTCQLVLTVFECADVEKQGVEGETGRKAGRCSRYWSCRTSDRHKELRKRKSENNQNWRFGCFCLFHALT